jgi:hypothetical protein
MKMVSRITTGSLGPMSIVKVAEEGRLWRSGP